MYGFDNRNTMVMTSDANQVLNDKYNQKGEFYEKNINNYIIIYVFNWM